MIETLESRRMLADASNVLIEAGMHRLLQFDLVTTRVYNTTPTTGTYATKTIWLLNQDYTVFGAGEPAGTAGDDRISLRTGESGVVLLNVNGTDYSVTSKEIRIDARRGNDVIDLSGLSNVEGLSITVYGGAGDDTIVGSLAGEKVFAGDGNDIIAAGNGRDTVYCEAGDDSVRGNAHNDLLDGGDGADTLRGDAGPDNISGGANSDRVRGGEGNDVLDGGGSRDYLAGEAGNDTMSGGAGDDVLSGSDGLDSLRGDSGVDQLTGGADEDFFADLTEVIDKPAAPQIAAGDTPSAYPEVRITWDGPIKGSALVVEASTDNGVTWSGISDGSGNSGTEGMVYFLEDGRTYVFRAYADQEGMHSPYSGLTAPLTIPLGQPLNLWPYDVTGGSVELEWLDTSETEDHFEIFKLVGENAVKVGEAPAKTETTSELVMHRVTGLTHDTDYTFFIRAVRGNLFADSPALTVRTYEPAIELGFGEAVEINEVDGSVDINKGDVFELTLGVDGIDPSSLSWTVDWGDGSPVTVVPAGSSAAARMLQHVFPDGDPDHHWVTAYYVTVNAENDEGALQTQDLLVDVWPV